MKEESLAMALIKSKDKLIVIITILWFLSEVITIGGFIWYINQFDYSAVEEYTNTTDSGGNACIGDNCINGNGIS